MIHRHFVSGICKRCVEEKEAKERAEAEARREERAEAAERAEVGEAERVTVTFAERPFGMTSSKERTEAYLVVKCGEGKPAAKAGVRPGWRVVEVAGTPCGEEGLEAVQAILKGVELPAAVVFETVPSGADFCTACQQVLAAPLFSRKMRTKPPEKRRCTTCVEAAEGEAEREKEEAAEAAGAAAAAGGDDRPKSKLSEFQQLCADSAQEAQKVTGLRAVRGAGYGGRGRGRGRGGR